MKKQKFYSHIFWAFFGALLFLVPSLRAEGITAADSAAIAAKVAAQFDSLPKHGFAEITAIRNSTEFPGSLEFDQSTYPIHDKLPTNTIVAFKHKGTGKYLAARQIDIGGKKQWIWRPDAINSDDKAAQYQIMHHLSTVPTLRDYIGMSASVANDATIQANADGLVCFPTQSFHDELSDRQAHWTIQGGSLTDACFDSRPTIDGAGGVATYVEEDRVMHVGDDIKINTETATWGLAKLGTNANGDALNGSTDDRIMRYGDMVKIFTADNDFVVDMDRTIGRSRRKRSTDYGYHCWKITSFGNKNVGDPVLTDDVIRFTSLRTPSLNFVNRVFDINADLKGNRSTKGIPVYYQGFTPNSKGLGLRYALYSNGEGSITDKGWLQTYKSDYNGMNWSLKGKWGDGPRENKSARVAFRYVPYGKGYASSDGYAVVSRGQDGKWQALSDTKKFSKIAVIADNDVWGVTPDGNVWHWNGTAWSQVPSTVSFVNITANAKKYVYAVDQQGFMYLRTGNGWEKRPGQALGVQIANEEFKQVSKSGDDIYTGDSITLPPTGDYVFYVKAIALSDVCIKIAGYELILWGWNGTRSVIRKTGGGEVVAVDSIIPDTTKSIDIAVVMQGSSNTIRVYANGVRIMGFEDPSFSLNPNVAVLGASNVPVQYGPGRTAPIPPGVDLDPYMATRNDIGGLALASPQTVWFIASDGSLQKNDGGSDSTAQSALGKNVTGVSIADDGTIWAVRGNSEVWALNTSTPTATWEMRDPPLDKPFIVDIAVRNQNEIYLVAANGVVYLWDGKTWAVQKLEQSICKMSVGSGVTKVVTPIMETVRISQMMTHDKEGKPYPISEASKVGVEILSLGFGGNIAPNQTVSCMLPAQQNPEVSGFARSAADLQPGATLTVQPLASRGGAWPKKTFQEKNNATVSFFAQPTPKGDIQVILGDTISNSYLFKIKIGTAQNSRACIIRRTVDAEGNEVDEEVYGVDASQNPLAYAPPGNFTPYWVSYDEGLILVGMGLPGDRVFMAYRTETPPDLVDHAGFSTKDGQVEYANIQFSAPVVTEAIARIDSSLPGVISLAASTNAMAVDAADVDSKVSVKIDSSAPAPVLAPKTMNLKGGAISWQNLPFRVPGGATVGFSMQGSQQCALVIGEAKDTSKTHYIITFGEGNNEGLSVKRSTGKADQPYALLAFQSNKGYKGLNLDPAMPVKAWVSYDQGLFIVGHGAPGENPIFACSDILGSAKIQEVGFVALGSSACTVQDVTIAGPVDLMVEQNASSYDQQKASYNPSVSGPVDIILPFWYRLSQEGPSLKMYDKITNMSFFVAGVPQQGTLYSFLATIKDDGFLSMTSSAEPENPLQVALKREIVTLQTNATLEQQKSAMVAKRGQLDAADLHGKASLVQAQADALSKQAENVAATTNGLAGGLSMGGAGGAVLAAGVGLTGLAVTSALFAVSGAISMDAAKMRVKADEEANAAQRDAIKTQETALKMQQQASLLAGNAQFAFKSVNSYVFTDVPARPALGDASLTPELIAARNAVTTMMSQLNLLGVADAYEAIIGGLQEIVYRTTNCFVITDVVKKQFVDKLSDMVQAYQQLYGENMDARVANKLISLLFTSINNCFLISPYQDADVRDNLYAWANKQAQALIAAQAGIDLCPCFGEYIWLPFGDLSTMKDNFSVTFDASGKDDLFIAFAKEPARIRNTSTPVYEIKINNTKTTISLQSLGQSVELLKKADYTEGAIINNLQPQTYTIALSDGKIGFKIGDSKAFTWTDKYPYTGMRWVGISCWDKPISITNLSLPTPLKGAAQPAAAPAVSYEESEYLDDGAEYAEDYAQYQEVAPAPAVKVKPAAKPKPKPKPKPKAKAKRAAKKAAKPAVQKNRHVAAS